MCFFILQRRINLIHSIDNDLEGRHHTYKRWVDVIRESKDINEKS